MISVKKVFGNIQLRRVMPIGKFDQGISFERRFDACVFVYFEKDCNHFDILALCCFDILAFFPN